MTTPHDIPKARSARARTLDVIKFVLIGTIALFAIAAVGITLTIVERQQALRELARYNITWAATQALNETLRLENRVRAYAAPDSTVSQADIHLRLDILYNRLGVLRGADVAEFLDAEPSQRAIVDFFAQMLGQIEPLVERIDQPGNVPEVLRLLGSLPPRLTTLASAAHQYAARRISEDQGHLLRLHWLFTSLAAGLFVCGIILLALLARQHRMVRRAHDELRRTAEDLRRIKEAAEAANEAKSRFLANMSHELRTPLNAIIGFAEIMDREMLGPIGPPRYREYAGDILKSGKHMADLVSDVLTMAKLDAAQIDLHPVPFSLRELVETTVRMFGGTAIASGRRLLVEPEEGWPTLIADERAVRQMLLNLLSNAAKFSPEGSEIRIVCHLPRNGGLRLSVIDRGIGMTAADIELAVRPFHQVDGGLSRRYEGAGLGLSIVKGLIEQHGGTLKIESRPGHGTDVSLFFLPRSVRYEEPEFLARSA